MHSNLSKPHCLRLMPGQDLKLELLNYCQKNKLNAACLISAVGSLKKCNLRLANSKQYLQLDKNFEIVSATGTLSQDGCHIHLSIADETGAVIGGHLMNENLIYTTCEVVLLELNEFEFKREIDPQTTFKELSIYFKKS